MRREVQAGAKTEARVLGLIAVLCYSATLAAMLTCGYTLLALALRAAVQDFAAPFGPAGT